MLSESLGNQFSGRHANGMRFRFQVRPITRRPIYLPIDMKKNAAVIAILNGEDPLRVLNASSIQEAKRNFYELRAEYDFDFWAATKFFIHDINDADKIVPLIFNPLQNKVIGTMQTNYEQKQGGRYIFTKTGPACGLTTCIQAYIFWRQQFTIFRGNSNTCNASKFLNIQLKDNLTRYLGRCPSHASYKINIPAPGRSDIRAFFNTFKRPDALRGIDFAYVHMANMSQWYDPKDKYATYAHDVNISGVLLDYRALIVIEGNRPLDFPQNLENIREYYESHIKKPHLLPIFSSDKRPMLLCIMVMSIITTSPSRYGVQFVEFSSQSFFFISTKFCHWTGTYLTTEYRSLQACAQT